MPINVNLDLNKLADETITPLGNRISQTVIAIWDLTFGRIDNLNNKYQLKKEKELQDYKDQLEREINLIEPENMQEPNLSILGQALESSKYYFEEKELRTMFAKLVASSMDKTKASRVRTSFTNIIQQLNTIDALNLKSLSNKYRKPIARVEVDCFKNSLGRKYQYVYFSSKLIEPLSEEMSASLDNLQRLGLVEISFYNWFAEESVYNDFRDITYIYSFTSKEPKHGEKVIKISKGVVFLTNLGIQFTDICL